MPTTYAAVADVAAELKALFSSGFSESSNPTEAEITEQIAAASVAVRVRITHRLGSEPETDSDGAKLAKRGVVAAVCAWILRRASVGYGAADVEALTKPYREDYRDTLKEIDLLPDHFKTTTEPRHHVGRTADDHQRDPALSDDALSRTDLY
jgi:hypothetical protein